MTKTQLHCCLQVGQAALAPPASHLHPETDPYQPMGRTAAREAASGGLQRAVHHLEGHLRSTRQDALQLATAVVRLEKEKAALQRSLRQQTSAPARVLHQSWQKAGGDKDPGHLLQHTQDDRSTHSLEMLHRASTSPAGSSRKLSALQGLHTASSTGSKAAEAGSKATQHHHPMHAQQQELMPQQQQQNRAGQQRQQQEAQPLQQNKEPTAMQGEAEQAGEMQPGGQEADVHGDEADARLPYTSQHQPIMITTSKVGGGFHIRVCMSAWLSSSRCITCCTCSSSCSATCSAQEHNNDGQAEALAAALVHTRAFYLCCSHPLFHVDSSQACFS